MSDDDKPLFSGLNFSAKAWEWIFRLLLICLLLWAKANFVPISEFTKYKEDSETRRLAVVDRLDTIVNTLTRIDEKMKNDERQDRTLTDHETRLRGLEHRP